MNILTCTPSNVSFSRIQCCVCGTEMKATDRLDYTITRSGLFLCLDCEDELAIQHRRKRNNYT